MPILSIERYYTPTEVAHWALFNGESTVVILMYHRYFWIVMGEIQKVTKGMGLKVIATSQGRIHVNDNLHIELIFNPQHLYGMRPDKYIAYNDVPLEYFAPHVGIVI